MTTTPGEHHRRQHRPRAHAAAAAEAGEGQWTLGYREPLNANEQVKKDDAPLNVRARIENIYSKRGFASIDGDDLRGRFRWMGLYTQRKPGLRRRQDRHPRAARARRRVLHDAGPHATARCSPSTPLRTLGEISTRVRPRHRRRHRPARTSSTTGSASRTSRTIWERLDAVGLTHHSRPAATRRARSSAPPSPASPRTRSSTAPRRSPRSSGASSATPTFANLPRKYKTSVSGPPEPRRDARGQRRQLRRHRAPRARPRLRRLGRRRPVHQPDARPEARRLGPARRGRRRLGGRHLASSATTATAGCAAAPA